MVQMIGRLAARCVGWLVRWLTASLLLACLVGASIVKNVVGVCEAWL